MSRQCCTLCFSALVTHDDFFHSEYFTCLLTVKIAWGQEAGVGYLKVASFYLKNEDLIGYCIEEDNVIDCARHLQSSHVYCRHISRAGAPVVGCTCTAQLT